MWADHVEGMAPGPRSVLDSRACVRLAVLLGLPRLLPSTTWHSWREILALLTPATEIKARSPPLSWGRLEDPSGRCGLQGLVGGFAYARVAAGEGHAALL